MKRETLKRIILTAIAADPKSADDFVEFVQQTNSPDDAAAFLGMTVMEGASLLTIHDLIEISKAAE